MPKHVADDAKNDVQLSAVSAMQVGSKLCSMITNLPSVEV